MNNDAGARALRGRIVEATIAMATAVAVVLYVQYGLGVAPCHLCYAERVPYYVGCVTGLAAIGLAARGPRWSAAAGAFCLALVAAWGAALGVRHVGVERAWWAGPTSCSSGTAGLADPRDLLAQLHELSLVACDKVSFTLLGQSLATWNAVLMLALSAYLVHGVAASLRKGPRVGRGASTAALSA